MIIVRYFQHSSIKKIRIASDAFLIAVVSVIDTHIIQLYGELSAIKILALSGQILKFDLNVDTYIMLYHNR